MAHGKGQRPPRSYSHRTPPELLYVDHYIEQVWNGFVSAWCPSQRPFVEERFDEWTKARLKERGKC